MLDYIKQNFHFHFLLQMTAKANVLRKRFFYFLRLEFWGVVYKPENWGKIRLKFVRGNLFKGHEEFFIQNSQSWSAKRPFVRLDPDGTWTISVWPIVRFFFNNFFLHFLWFSTHFHKQHKFQKISINNCFSASFTLSSLKVEHRCYAWDKKE